MKILEIIVAIIVGAMALVYTIGILLPIFSDRAEKSKNERERHIMPKK